MASLIDELIQLPQWQIGILLLTNGTAAVTNNIMLMMLEVECFGQRAAGLRRPRRSDGGCSGAED